MKPKVTIALDELVRLRNRVAYLEGRLELYEPKRVEKKITLIDRDGNPTSRSEYGLRKPGPSSMLEDYPTTFSREFVLNNGGTPHLLAVWKSRGYLTSDETNTVYTKTERYIKRLEQSRLKRLTAEKEINIFTKSF